jgi:hypothetical protein
MAEDNCPLENEHERGKLMRQFVLEMKREVLSFVRVLMFPRFQPAQAVRLYRQQDREIGHRKQ